MSTGASHDLAQALRDQAHLLGPALGRAWDRQITCTAAAEPATRAEALLELGKPGLLVAWIHEGKAGALLVPEGTVLPAAFRTPTAEQHGRLQAAAGAFGKSLLPGGVEAEDTHLAPLDDLGQWTSQLAEEVQLARLAVAAGEHSSPAWVAWPLPLDLLPQMELTPAGAASPAGPPPFAATCDPAGDFDAALQQLPAYTRSLLRIEVPVVVTLATKRDVLSSVLQLGLGSILQFDKGCDETLDLEVAGRRIAEGEPVKVGDKFGLRITAVALPEERFIPIGKRPAA